MSNFKSEYIALLVKRVELQLGRKQKDIASIIGVSESYLSQVVRGKKEPSKRLVDSLLELVKDFDATGAFSELDRNPMKDVVNQFDDTTRSGLKIIADHYGTDEVEAVFIAIKVAASEVLQQSLNQRDFKQGSYRSSLPPEKCSPKNLDSDEYDEKTIMASPTNPVKVRRKKTPENQLKDEGGN